MKKKYLKWKMKRPFRAASQHKLNGLMSTKLQKHNYVLLREWCCVNIFCVLLASFFFHSFIRLLRFFGFGFGCIVCFASAMLLLKFLFFTFYCYIRASSCVVFFLRCVRLSAIHAHSFIWCSYFFWSYHKVGKHTKYIYRKNTKKKINQKTHRE